MAKNAAKVKKGGDPGNAAAAGRGFTNGAVFFWGEKRLKALILQDTIKEIVGQGKTDFTLPFVLKEIGFVIAHPIHSYRQTQ